MIDGVISTKPGWIQKFEVVEVEFDPKVVSFASLLAKARACNCASRVFTRSDAQQALAKAAIGGRSIRSDERVRIVDNKYYASRSALRALPMTSLQSARVNAVVCAKGDVKTLLSPAQCALWARIKADSKGWPVALGKPFRAAWDVAQVHATRVRTK